MNGLFLFGGILFLLIATIVWSAIRAGEDTGTALEPAERRDAAIEALRDLELEFRTGKLTDGEYQAVRAHLEREALDARNRVHTSGEAGGVSSVGPSDPESRSDSGGRTSAPAFCSGCGTALEGGDAYCHACGTKI